MKEIRDILKDLLYFVVEFIIMALLLLSMIALGVGFISGFIFIIKISAGV